MSDLHGPSAAAAKDLAAADQSASDSRADSDVEDRIEASSGAKMGLGKSGGVGVVVQHGRPAETALEPFHQRKILPAFDLVAGDDQPVLGIDRAAKADGDAGNLLTGDLCPNQQVFDP